MLVTWRRSADTSRCQRWPNGRRGAPHEDLENERGQVALSLGKPWEGNIGHTDEGRGIIMRSVRNGALAQCAIGITNEQLKERDNFH